jgi:predicted negative regulator of RcsB-dependent stress response
VYESVGDVYVQKGNKQEAKKYYDVFLKFEPENKRILKKIQGLAL